MNAAKDEARHDFLELLQVACESLVELEQDQFGLVLAQARKMHELIGDAVSDVRKAIESPRETGDREERDERPETLPD